MNLIFKAISQRDDTQYYPFIGANREDIIKDITSFYKEQIQPKFPLDDYVIDVFRSKKDSVKLVDFNPFGITTDAILFDWNEEPLTDPAESTTEWYQLISRMTQQLLTLSPQLWNSETGLS